MTEIIRLEIKSIEHENMQPSGLRYAVSCSPVLTEPLGADCESIKRRGHLGDFPYYQGARKAAVAHPHSAVISFYPYVDEENREIGPARQFLKDFKNQAKQSPRR